MKRLLHIDASPRGDRSHSRRLSREFVDALQSQLPLEVVYRDVGREPLPFVDEAWIAAAFNPPERRTPQMCAALAVSDALVDELSRADTLVIGLPMYNFGVPASFKAYIDQIVRVGRTFAFEPEDTTQPYKPLLRDKRTFVIVATGDAGYETGGPFAALNHVDPYLRTVFRFIGITDVHFVHVGNDEFGGEKLDTSLRRAREHLQRLSIVATQAAEDMCALT